MSKGYNFLDVEYQNLNDLGVSYSENFEFALKDIYENTKRLIQFVKKTQKKLAKQVVSYFTESKYKNNVLTFLIFTFCEDKRVVINGETYDFKKFVQDLRTHKKAHRAIYAFMEDFGITKTFATLNIEPHLEEDAYFIEKNIEDEFTYEYISTFYNFDYVESLQSYISNIFIYDEERFRRTIKVIKNEKFCLLLAHKVGFKNVFELRNETMPVFKTVSLLRDEFDEKDLKRILEDTFYWWLLDNFEKYTYKKEAKNVFKTFKTLKKEKQKLDKKYDFNTFIELSSKLYDLYIEHVNYVRKGLIQIKKKVDVEQFTLDKAYCGTFICYDFMKDNTVKLSKENVSDEEQVQEELQEEVPVEEEKSTPTMDAYLKQEKLINKWKRFITCSLVFTILCIIAAGVYIGSGLIMQKNLLDLYDMTSLFIFLGAVVLYMICVIVFRVRIGKTQKALDNVIYITNLSNINMKHTTYQEKELQKLKGNEEIFRKKAMRGHRIISCIVATIFGAIPAGSMIYAISLFDAQMENSFINWKQAFVESNMKFLYFGIGVGFGLLYGLIRKRKGAFTAILITLVSLVGVIALAFIMQ